MSSPIIQVHQLSKSFIISHERKERYTALRDVMTDKVKRIFSFPFSFTQVSQRTREEFWALKDVSFEINAGDRLGIIGRNGAGKSTLLKILSRITEPTKGEIKIKGRVASLLEVGTGFHPELTGKENIFLNGAILGMSRSEIKSKYDEIVDFAEVEKFLDTPVKRYSSGMYVRLAFAVAAYLESEILVVDEVLAVGDTQFQKKCLGKMEDVSKNAGRAVIFVSHNMGVVRTLCNKGMLLKNGELSLYSTVEHVVSEYLSISNEHEIKFIDLLAWNIEEMEVTGFTINNNSIGEINLVDSKKLRIEITGTSYKSIEGALDVSLYNSFNERIVFYSPGHLKNEFITLKGAFNLSVEIELPDNLNGGDYGMQLNFSFPNIETFFATKENIQISIPPTIAINGREFTYENSAYILMS